MRTIKFRMLDATENEFYLPYPTEDNIWPFGFFNGVPDIPNGWTMEQFTGLFDEQGKEIYEGDIVVYLEYQSHTGKGEFVRKVEVVTFREGFYDPVYIDDDEFLIIGNIHENAELLNQSE